MKHSSTSMWVQWMEWMPREGDRFAFCVVLPSSKGIQKFNCRLRRKYRRSITTWISTEPIPLIIRNEFNKYYTTNKTTRVWWSGGTNAFKKNVEVQYSYSKCLAFTLLDAVL